MMGHDSLTFRSKLKISTWYRLRSQKKKILFKKGTVNHDLSVVTKDMLW